MSLSSCQIDYLFWDRNLLNNIWFSATSTYEIVKRNKNLKNPWNNNVCNERFSNFLLSIKYMDV